MFKKLFAVGFILAAGAVSAMASGTDTGFVVDNNGNPVAGAVVTYTRTIAGVGGSTTTWLDTTNASGVYRFKLGVTQSLTVIGQSTTAGNFIAKMVGYDSSTAQAFTVTVADTTGAAVVGNPTNLVITARTVTGTIQDAHNATLITNAQVQQKRGNVIVATTSTNASGVYSLSIVASGDSLIVTAPSYLISKAVVPAYGAAGTANALTRTINFGLNAFGNVAGTVTYALQPGTPITGGVTVSLAPYVGGVLQTPTVITTTNAQGMYVIDSQTAYDSFKVEASQPSLGLTPSIVIIHSMTPGVDSVDFALDPAIAAIKGTITSISGPALGGATVTLTKGTTVVATATANAAGAYSFANDSVGVNYTITASSNGYTTTSVSLTPLAITTSDTVTENIVLPLGTIKTFWVKVISGTTSLPLANASVGVTQGASVIAGNTVAGVFQVTNAPVGFDTITVADTLFLAQQFIITSNATSADTIYDTLTQVANGTPQRALRGTAHELTGTGAVAPGALIVFKSAGGYVFAATTLANGTWSVVGIPAAVTAVPAYAAATGLGLHATLAGWTPYNNGAQIAIAATGTTISNTVIFPSTGVISPAAEKVAGTPAFSVMASGIISLKNMIDPGVVKVFNLQGKMLYNHAFGANTASLHVSALTQGKNAYVVSITQNKAEYKRVILMP
jgi:hypothetical protein